MSDEEDKTARTKECHTCDGSGWFHDPTIMGVARTRGWGTMRPCHDLACPIQGEKRYQEENVAGEEVE